MKVYLNSILGCWYLQGAIGKFNGKFFLNLSGVKKV